MSFDYFDYQPAQYASDWERGRVAAMPPRAEVIEYTHHYKPESTSVMQVFYNQNTRRLTVEFSAGGAYSYDNVSPQRFRALKKAESTGRYVRSNFTAAGHTGAKHGVNFTPVEVPVRREAVEDTGSDLDKLKIEKLTTGEGEVFTLHFDYTGSSSVEVRAADVLAAKELFASYFADSGLNVSLTKAEIHFK